MAISIWKRGLSNPHKEMGNPHFHIGNQKLQLPIFIWGSPNRKGDFHIPIWKWGMPISIWGITTNNSLFPYGDPHMETGIDTSPYGNGECPFPYGESKEMVSCFQKEIPIWKWGLTHPHMEMGFTRFHMGNQKIWLPIFIWGSPYRNRDFHIV
jgi:hypothetical protein